MDENVLKQVEIFMKRADEASNLFFRIPGAYAMNGACQASCRV